MGFMYFWSLLSKKETKMSIETLKKYRHFIKKGMSVAEFINLVKDKKWTID